MTSVDERPAAPALNDPGPPRLPRKRRPGTVVGSVIGLVLFAAVVAPIVAVLLHVVTVDGGVPGIIERTLSAPTTFTALRNTVILGVTAGIVTTGIASGLAWLLYRTNLPGRGVMRTLVVVPFFIPVLVTSVSWTLLTGSNAGLINRLLRWIGIEQPVSVYNLPGMAFVLCLALVPIAFIFIRSAFAEPDAEQEEAAMVSGAGVARVTFGVTLPRILPSLGATVLLVFVLAAGNFSVTGVLGIPYRVDTLSSEIFVAMNTVPADFGHVAAVAAILLILMSVLLFFQFRLERRSRTIETKSSGKTAVTWDLGAWRWPAFALVTLYLFVVVVLPITAIVLASILPYWGAPLGGLTFDNVSRLFAEGGTFQQSIYNTVQFAAIGATVTVAIGLVAAYVFRRLRPPGARIFDAVSTSSFALPGIVVGLGYLWISVQTPLYATLTIMIVVVTVQLLPIALRLVSAGLTRANVALDEAGRVSGAREWQVFWDIVRPQLGRALASGWILLFLIFTHEVDALVLIYGPTNSVLATEIYGQYSNGHQELAGSAALILLALTAVVLGILGLVARLASHRRSLGDLL